MRSCGSWLSSSAVTDRAMCSIVAGLSNSSRTPPATSRMPSSPFSTRPILKVLSRAGDSGSLAIRAAGFDLVICSALPSRPAGRPRACLLESLRDEESDQSRYHVRCRLHDLIAVSYITDGRHVGQGALTRTVSVFG